MVEVSPAASLSNEMVGIRKTRWDLRRMHEALDARRRERGMTWQELAVVLRWTPSQFTGLKRVHLAIGMKLAMRVAQWLERPGGTLRLRRRVVDPGRTVTGDQSLAFQH